MAREIYQYEDIKGHIWMEEFGERKIYGYMPPSYDGSLEKFPVVYLQDGGDFFLPEKNRVLSVLEGNFEKNKLKEVILIGIEPKQRLDEYSPWYATALSKRFKDFGGKGDVYIRFIVEELKPFIDASFNTDPSVEGTGIMGASLGGLISMYAACVYPEVFGRIGCISASFWYEDFLEYIVRREISNIRSKKIYMDVGSLEGHGKDSRQIFMVSNTKAIYDAFLEKGIGNENIRLDIDHGASHNYKFFADRFPKAIEWLFSKD